MEWKTILQEAKAVKNKRNFLAKAKHGKLFRVFVYILTFCYNINAGVRFTSVYDLQS